MTITTPPITTPPVAAKRPQPYTRHGVTVQDDYAWLRDPGYPKVDNPEIIAHLTAENAWFEGRMAPQKPLIDRLFTEMRGRVKEADRSVPQKDGDWLYWIEFEEGAEYKKWWRRPVGAPDDGSADQLLLDEVAAHLDALFDQFLLSFDEHGRALISPQLDGAACEVLGLRPTMQMRWVAPEHQRYMGYHRQRFLTGP